MVLRYMGCKNIKCIKLYQIIINLLVPQHTFRREPLLPCFLLCQGPLSISASHWFHQVNDPFLTGPAYTSVSHPSKHSAQPHRFTPPSQKEEYRYPFGGFQRHPRHSGGKETTNPVPAWSRTHSFQSVA
jgi:hypothetical protein